MEETTGMKLPNTEKYNFSEDTSAKVVLSKTSEPVEGSFADASKNQSLAADIEKNIQRKKSDELSAGKDTFQTIMTRARTTMIKFSNLN